MPSQKTSSFWTGLPRAQSLKKNTSGERGQREKESERKVCKPYTLTSHTITHSNQEAQRKAGGLQCLREALGGLDTRRHTNHRVQLSDKVVTKGQGQPAKAVRVRRGEQRGCGAEQEIEEHRVNTGEGMMKKYVDVGMKRGTKELDNMMEK